jgi:hypothetical protein
MTGDKFGESSNGLKILRLSTAPDNTRSPKDVLINSYRLDFTMIFLTSTYNFILIYEIYNYEIVYVKFFGTRQLL